MSSERKGVCQRPVVNIDLVSKPQETNAWTREEVPQTGLLVSLFSAYGGRRTPIFRRIRFQTAAVGQRDSGFEIGSVSEGSGRRLGTHLGDLSIGKLHKLEKYLGLAGCDEVDVKWGCARRACAFGGGRGRRNRDEGLVNDPFQSAAREHTVFSPK
jgi:hypothetical protein